MTHAARMYVCVYVGFAIPTRVPTPRSNFAKCNLLTEILNNPSGSRNESTDAMLNTERLGLLHGSDCLAAAAFQEDNCLVQSGLGL